MVNGDRFRSIIAVGKKLFLGLDIRLSSSLTFPQKEEEIREWPEWHASLTILSAFLMQRTAKTNPMEGSGEPVIDWCLPLSADQKAE